MLVKSKLIEQLAKKQPFIAVEEVHHLVNIVLETMAKTLCQGGRIEIRGFGTFAIRYHQARRARNPKTGQQFMTEPSYGIHFKVGKALRERVQTSRLQMLSSTEATDGSNE